MERNLKIDATLGAKTYQELLIIKIISLNLVQSETHGSFQPKHHLVRFPKNFRPLNVNFQNFIKSFRIIDGVQFKKMIRITLRSYFPELMSHDLRESLLLIVFKRRMIQEFLIELICVSNVKNKSWIKNNCP
jgi:hypothetical protein